MYFVEHMTIMKRGSSGEASVKIVDEDGNPLFLNKFIIDITDGANPVGIPKYQGVNVFSGPIVSKIEQQLLDIFTTKLDDYNSGIFKISKHGIEKQSD